MHRSYNHELVSKLADCMECNHGFDWKSWVEDSRNLLFEEDGAVGLATYEYPGFYTVHWYFDEKHRGRKAIKLGKEMIQAVFDHGAFAVRGLTPEDNKAARWAVRQVGLKSYGLIRTLSGMHELFCISKEDWIK